MNGGISLKAFSSSSINLSGLKKPKRSNIIQRIKRDRYLFIMTAIGVIYFLIFNYLPIYGMQLAFRRFTLVGGIWNSPWVGFHNFKVFFENPASYRIVRNTIILGFYSLIWGFWPPIMLALLLNEVKQRTYKRVIQTVSYLPHFIAMVIIVGMLKDFFSYKGIVNQVIASFGGRSINFFSEIRWFRSLYIGSGIWQGIGFGTIIYLAVLSSVNPELYESAILDGANRFQRVIYITIPSILPTIMILLILSTASVVSVGFEKVYLMYSPGIYEVADVLSTYTYRLGLEGGQFGFGAAVGMLNSIVSFILLASVNAISRKVTDYSMW